MSQAQQQKEDHEVLDLVTTLAARGELHRLKNTNIMTDEERSAEAFRQQVNGYDLDAAEQSPESLFEASMQLRQHNRNIEADRLHRPDHKKRPFVSGSNPAPYAGGEDTLLRVTSRDDMAFRKAETDFRIKRLVDASKKKLQSIGLAEGRITESAEPGAIPANQFSADSRIRVMINKAGLIVQKDGTVFYGRRKLGLIHNFTLSPDGTTIADRGRPIWKLGQWIVLESAGGVVKRRDTKKPIPCPECGGDLLAFKDVAHCDSCEFKMPFDKSNKMYASGRTVFVEGTTNEAG
jgi:hypothetical protein